MVLNDCSALKFFFVENAPPLGILKRYMETRAFKLSGYMIILVSTFNFVCFSDM